MLGYFSLIGLLRLHSLLGDYYQALKVLENIDFNKKVIFLTVWQSLYKMLGYFSLIGLLRLHSLLGDYYQALKVLENIDFNKKVIFLTVWQSLYKMLGYFSLIGLLRLHSLLGDYYQALKVLENISDCRSVSDCRFSCARSTSARSHTFVKVDHEMISTVIFLPSADSKSVVVSYKQKYVLVNRLVKLTQEKCVVR